MFLIVIAKNTIVLNQITIHCSSACQSNSQQFEPYWSSELQLDKAKKKSFVANSYFCARALRKLPLVPHSVKGVINRISSSDFQNLHQWKLQKTSWSLSNISNCMIAIAVWENCIHENEVLWLLNLPKNYELQCTTNTSSKVWRPSAQETETWSPLVKCGIYCTRSNLTRLAC
jgi:hypothetical protein